MLMRCAALLLLLVAGGGLVACTGGGGDLPDFYDGWESDRGERNNREVSGRSMSDPAATSAETPPGGASGFVCSGVFACTVTSQGKTATGRIALQTRDGVCMAGDEAILEPGGVLRISEGDNQAIQTGTWTASGDTLQLSAGGLVANCVRTTGPADSTDDDEDNEDSPSSGSGGSTDKPQVDAGS
jgi:hypothetical protein